MVDNWEVALISAIERELAQLEWLLTSSPTLGRRFLRRSGAALSRP
jgi:hypothetical protein